MALSRDRTRHSVRGLGKLEVREVLPTPAALYDDAGYLGGTTIEDMSEVETIIDEAGEQVNALERQRTVNLQTALRQVSIDEWNLLKNAGSKVHSLRYSGLATLSRFQYFCMEQTRLHPKIPREFRPGVQAIPLIASILKQDNSVFDTPTYYLLETRDRIRTENLELWVSPRHGYNSETSRLLDVSGFVRHGVLNADFATIWQQTTTPAEFLRFDGSNDEVNFGNILNDDGSGDFVIEVWFRPQGANGTDIRIMGKKAVLGDNTAGFVLYRNTSNGVTFKLSSGSASALVASANSVSLQNVWKHVAVSIDRNGNGQMYINGVASGSPVSVSAIGTGTNSNNLYLGRDNAAFGQTDESDARIYRFAGGALPADVATMILRHYDAEKSYHGL